MADFALQLGDLAQVMTVTDESPLLEAASPSLAMIIDEKQASELPVAGGSPYYLTRLSPGVLSTGGHSPGNPFDQGHASSAIIVSGTRSGSSEVSLDARKQSQHPIRRRVPADARERLQLRER